MDGNDMLNRWLTRRHERRTQRLAALAASARARTFDIVQELAAPLVADGLARLEWTEPDPNDESFANGAVDLIPANDDAAPIQVFPDPGLVTLLIGPQGHAHELVIDSDHWQEELRSCLQAVIDGRYRERTEQGHISRRVVTMTFEQPGGHDVVVKHFDFTVDGDDEPLGERRFASYRE